MTGRALRGKNGHPINPPTFRTIYLCVREACACCKGRDFTCHENGSPIGPRDRRHDWCAAAISALRAFERAGTLLSFRCAAQELALTPSAVSHQIRGLEQRFGVALFRRNGRSVQLTADGQRYHQSVGAALALLDSACRDLLHQTKRGRPDLRISTLPFFTSTVLLPALADFERRNPGLTLHIAVTHQYADFDGSGVDVAIRFGRERSSGLRLEPLVEVRALPVCAPRLVDKGLRQPADLARQVLIHVAQHPAGWSHWLEDAGLANLTPQGELWIDSVPAALEAAEHGLGVALAMHPLIRARKGFGRTLVAPFDVCSKRAETLYLVFRPQQAHDRRIAAFRRWLQQAVRLAAGA